MSCCQNRPSRRTFLAAGGFATAAATLAACASEPEREDFSGGEMTPALAIEDLPVGESVQMAVGANQLLIYREDEQVVHAYSAVCTHEGCIVGVGENEPSEPFVCPCHASNYDKLSGEPVAGPAPLPLTRHDAKITDGWIHVEVEPAT